MSLRLCGAALLVASALLVAGCGGGGETGSAVTAEPIGFQELVRSAARSSDATSGRFSFEMSMTLPGTSEPLRLSGEGAFDARAKRISFAVDMSALAKTLGGFVSGLAGPNAGGLPDFDDPEGWKIEIVQDGSVDYVRFPALDDRLPAGKSWLRGAQGISAGAFDFRQFTGGDPREALDALRGVTSDIETVGSEQLRGVETTHYRAVVDPAKLATAKDVEGQSPPQSLADRLTGGSIAEIPVDVWLDANGLVRKLSMELSASKAGAAQTSEATMSFELWDYGEDVEIALPPASQVVDASAVGG